MVRCASAGFVHDNTSGFGFNFPQCGFKMFVWTDLCPSAQPMMNMAHVDVLGLVEFKGDIYICGGDIYVCGLKLAPSLIPSSTEAAV